MRDYFIIYINGQRHEVRGGDAFVSLSDYLRVNLGLTGTKIVCSEGDCGACSVLVGRVIGETLSYVPVDACICFIYQLDRCHIVSVEGLSRNGTLSPVQTAMVDCFGSQCGFCTPGFVVTMSGMLEQASCEQGRRLSEDQWRLGLSGNLCRCTGYVQILEAGKSIDPVRLARLEDLYPSLPMLSDFSQHEHASVQVQTQVGERTRTLFAPVNLSEALQFKATHPDARVVSGATDVGVVTNKGRLDPDMILSLKGIPGHDRLEVVANGLQIGMNTTWSAIERWSEANWSEFHRIVTRFGSPQIRNVSTLAGNIANGSPIADSLPLLHVMDATVQLASHQGTRSVNINDFYHGYKQLALRPDELISSIQIPLPDSADRLRLYKVSRRHDMDISTFTAAVRISLAGDVIQTARIAYGGVGPIVLRLPKTEQFLCERQFTEDNLLAAGDLAVTEITPISDVRGSREFRLQLARNVLRRFFFDVEAGLATV